MVDKTDTTLAQNAVKKRIGEPGYNPDAKGTATAPSVPATSRPASASA